MYLCRTWTLHTYFDNLNSSRACSHPFTPRCNAEAPQGFPVRRGSHVLGKHVSLMCLDFGVLKRDWAVATLLRIALFEGFVELRDRNALRALKVA